EADAAQKCGVERRLHVGGQHTEAAIGLHALEQVVDFDVGVTVVTVFDLAALSEEGIGLIEEEDGAAIFGCVKDAAQVLFGLSNVFVDYAREVDAVEVKAKCGGEDFGRHGFSRAAGAGKQSADSQTATTGRAESPLLVDSGAMSHVRRDFPQHLF